MADTTDHGWPGRAYTVDVRRPLHRVAPHGRLRERWRALGDARRAARKRDDGPRWWDALEIPDVGDADGCAGPLALIVVLVVLIVLLVFAGPFLWILFLFVLDALIWFVLAIAGLVAWLLLRRPWQVVVTDPEGAVVASVAVTGRRRARQHAIRVEQRLAAGATPTAAITVL